MASRTDQRNKLLLNSWVPGLRFHIMEHVDRILEKADSSAELEIIKFAA